MKKINVSLNLMLYLDGNTFKFLTYLLSLELDEIRLSINYMASTLKMDGKTIQKCIKTLENNNILNKENGATRRDSNIYSINNDAIINFF